MQIKKVVNTIFQSNTFILIPENSDGCWLVDAGDLEPVLEVVGSNPIKGVFITHTHYDHIYGLPELIGLYPDCLIYTSADGKDGLASDKFNLSRYHGDPIALESPNVRILNDGDSVELDDGNKLTAVLTPGHDKSSVTYYTDESLFTGDSYIPGLDVVTTFPRSDRNASDMSLNKIKKLMETRTVFPGHKS